MLNLQDIEQVVTMVANSRLVEVEIITENQHLRVKNRPSTLISPALSPEQHTTLPIQTQTNASTNAPSVTTTKPITSKYIGYVQLAADKVTPAFKKVGDSVAVGETVAVVAQLGRLLPVTSEQSGVITEIQVQDNQRVEYGTPLFSLA